MGLISVRISLERCQEVLSQDGMHFLTVLQLLILWLKLDHAYPLRIQSVLSSSWVPVLNSGAITGKEVILAHPDQGQTLELPHTLWQNCGSHVHT